MVLTNSCFVWVFLPCGSDSKASACRAGDPGSIPRSGRSPGEGNGYPLQCSCPPGSSVHGITKSRTGVSDFHFHSPHTPSGKGRVSASVLPGADVSHQCLDVHPLLFRVFSSPSTAHSPQCACPLLTEPMFWYVCVCVCVCVRTYVVWWADAHMMGNTM